MPGLSRRGAALPYAHSVVSSSRHLVVHREALDGELLDDARGPLAELHSALGVDLVPDGDDGREVVVLRVVALGVGSSYPKASDN